MRLLLGRLRWMGLGIVGGAILRSLFLAAPSVGKPGGPTIEQVQSLSSLITEKVDVADVLVTAIEGYTGSVTAALVLKGDFLLGVDLSRARFESMDPVLHSATLILPQPSVTSPRVDQDRTRLFALKDHGLWIIIPDSDQDVAVVNQAYTEAQRLIEQSAEDPSLMYRACRQTETVLESFFKVTGWRVSVRWDNPSSP